MLLNKITGSVGEEKEETRLVLKMFVEGNSSHQLFPFDEAVMDNKLREESEIFVVPSVSGPDEAFIVLDNTSGKESKCHFFKIKQIKSKPEVSSTGYD